MKPRHIVAAIALVGFACYLTLVWGPAATPPEARIVRPAPTLPADWAALSGVWESVAPATIPGRLVVEDIHEQWATIFLAWGDHPEGRYEAGSFRAKAKVLPDGTLHLHQMGEFFFRLSDDWNNLIAKQDQGSRVGVVVMRRVPPNTALTALSAPHSQK